MHFIYGKLAEIKTYVGLYIYVANWPHLPDLFASFSINAGNWSWNMKLNPIIKSGNFICIIIELSEHIVYCTWFYVMDAS